MDAYDIGFEHGKMVPAISGTANSEQAWSDLRAAQQNGDLSDIDAEWESLYVRGHMAGQVAN